MDAVNTSIATFHFIAPERDIIVAGFKESVRLDLEMAIQIVAERLRFSQNKDHYLVADVSNVISMTSDAKKFFQQPQGGLKNILGAALIAPNPLSSLIANIFIKTPAQFKSRFFSNQADALAWIISQRDKVRKHI